MMLLFSEVCICVMLWLGTVVAASAFLVVVTPTPLSPVFLLVGLSARLFYLGAVALILGVVFVRRVCEIYFGGGGDGRTSCER